MSRGIAAIADFTGTSVSPNVCFILGTPKPRDEVFVYRIGKVEPRRGGTVEISAQAARELAQKVGYLSPEERTTLQNAIEALEEDNARLEQERDDARALEQAVRHLARELDLAQATRDDAIKQFNDADLRLRAIEKGNKGGRTSV